MPRDDIDVRPGLYQHYKGGLYMVLSTAVMGTGHDEETMVVYQNAEGQFWVRTLEDFTDLVNVDGLAVSRFRRVGKAR